MADGAHASPPFKPDIGEVADAGGVRVVAVAKHRDIDQVRRRRIFPDLGIDAGEIGPLVEPAADPILAAIGNEMGEAANVLVVLPLLADCPKSPPSHASRRGRLGTGETAVPGDRIANR